MEGFIRFLMGSSNTAKSLRRAAVFKIVPMMNADGVVMGNYRTSFAGADLNRVFDSPDKRRHPEVCALK